MIQVSHEYADSNGVRIHYAKAGAGPLVVFVHGFPDFWYSWHHQMQGLSDEYSVVALDTRGYNESDKPDGVESYDMTLLVADVAAVIRNEGRESAIIVGHDWGGAVAWGLATTMPELVGSTCGCGPSRGRDAGGEPRSSAQDRAHRVGLARAACPRPPRRLGRS